MESRSTIIRAALATSAVAAGALFFGVKEAASPWGLEWGVIGLACAYGVVGLLLQIRSLVAQVIARGALWVAVLPASLYSLTTFAHGQVPDASAIATALAGVSALLLARPLLYTDRARKELSPAHCRPLFLTSAIWAAIAGVPSLTMGIVFDHGVLRLFVLGVLLLATAIGVVRMRGWSVLTAIASAILGLVLTVTEHFTPMLLTAVPGVLLVVTLFLARSAASRVPTHVRVASNGEEQASTPREGTVRIESLYLTLDEPEDSEAMGVRHLNQ